MLFGCTSGYPMEFINPKTGIKNKCNFCEYYKAMIENDKEVEKTKRYSVIVQSKTLINGKEKGTYIILSRMWQKNKMNIKRGYKLKNEY